ncbi:MAG TPA: hypothetical protein PLN38_04865 [Chitinophagales bacterium]|nr:hypothetical protein [Chitinophagales bacterium]
MHEVISFDTEQVIKYVGIIITVAGLYFALDYRIKKSENDITSMKNAIKEVSETHQSITGSLIEISTTQNSFMARAEEQWERSNNDLSSIIKNQDAFNKMVAERFAKYDENILEFYKKNGHLFGKG